MKAALNREWWRGQVRLPHMLAEWLKIRAKTNFRSMNGELVELVAEAKRRQESEKENAPVAGNN